MIRRIGPALGLLVLAPWVGEFLLGNVSIRMLAALPVLIPLYGGGALLVREVTRRLSRGWPTMLLLGAAYGVIEAGLVDQSLFNPAFEGHDFQSVTPIPALGISAYNATAFVIGHAIWSIGIPIALVELLTPARRTVPWLGPIGLGLTAALYVFGCWFIFQAIRDDEGFLARPSQLAGAAITAAVLIGLAFAIPRGHLGGGATPRPWLVGLSSFLLAGAFFVRPESWAGVVFGLLVAGAAATVFLRWSQTGSWTVRHQFALVAGALPIYAMAGFVLTLLLEPEDPVRWSGNAIFAALAAGLLIVTGWRVSAGGQRDLGRAGNGQQGQEELGERPDGQRISDRPHPDSAA